MTFAKLMHMSTYDAGVWLWHEWIHAFKQVPAWHAALLLAVMIPAAIAAEWFQRRRESREKN